jgi:hypothetical protein
LYNRRYQITACVVLIIALSVIVASNNPVQTIPTKTEQSKFIIASWDFPDEYGQGIYAMRVYENSTGSWVNVGGWIEYYEEAVFEWNEGVGIKIQCDSMLNATLTGAGSSSEGKNYLRHNATVTDRRGSVVCSQQNFTYLDDIDYSYSYEVILDFLPVSFESYTVTILYEIFW